MGHVFILMLFPFWVVIEFELFVQIQEALQRATRDSNSQVGSIFQVLHTRESPPTYFKTNKFTSAFQEIVDAYGLVPANFLANLHCKGSGFSRKIFQLKCTINWQRNNHEIQ